MSEKFSADQAEALFVFYKDLQKNLDTTINLPAYYTDLIRRKLPEFERMMAGQQ